ncbi:B-cell receptor CD22 isoform X2 [Ochotona princeps]|uniref:B-cell receptor CD22 isoform X2 n=1 Tax=Ochotona princeps TaxID=9978 RepID=UPI002714FEB3|nr:B-cell receptor CD22 isoform X2 [Ochotona princeps]
MNSSLPRTPPGHSSMHLHRPWLLLLVCVALSDQNPWIFELPKTLYAWEGTCVWIPCTYIIPKLPKQLSNITMYLNPVYDTAIKSYTGTVLFNYTRMEEKPPSQGKVLFVGDKQQNCTFSIRWLQVSDSGELGIRMETETDKWMETINLNISKKPLAPHIQLPSADIREYQSVTLTCSVNFSCWENPIQLQWSLDGTVVQETIVTTESVSTQSKLTFTPQWTHHGQNLTCQLQNATEPHVLSEDTVRLNVKHPPKEVTTVIQSPTPIREGDSVTLACSYNSSNPSVSRYEWRLPGNKPSSSEVVTIPKVAWDAKAVTCAACNNWCSWAPLVNLDVQYAPRGVKVRQQVQAEIRAGQRVTLQCECSGSRPQEVHFSWKKNGRPVQEGKELTFDSITPEDAGSYSCLANNSVGQRTSDPWTLQVLYAPRRLQVIMTPGNSVMEGKQVVLTCDSDANPPVSHYAWLDWNNQEFYFGQMLKLEPTTVQHSGAYRCQGTNRLGRAESPPRTLTIYYSPETIGRRVAVGIGCSMAVLILTIWGFKLRQKWKRIRSQQGAQDNFSGQSFFVKNPKVRRPPLPEGSHSLGCYNPVMEDGISYATLRFPEVDTSSAGDTGTAELQRPSLSGEDTVTYSVVQKRRVADYENVPPNLPEDEGIHYSELVRFGTGVRPQAQEDVDYVTLKQ